MYGSKKSHVNVIQAVNSLHIVYCKVIDIEHNPLQTDSTYVYWTVHHLDS